MCPAVAVEEPPYPELSLGALVDFMEEVDQLPEDACGVFLVGSDPRRPGAVFVQQRRICWAAAPGLGQRLTHLIRMHAPRPIPEEELERMFALCREKGVPLGEALVGEGLISAEGLVDVLRRHTAESLARLFATTVTPRWIPRAKPEYDLRFSFSTGEVLSAIGAALEDMLDYRLEDRVPWLDKHQGGLVVYRRTDMGVLPVAMHQVPHWSAREVWDIGRWAIGYHDMIQALDPANWLSSASSRDDTTCVILRSGTLYFLLTCDKRQQVSRILHELISDRRKSGGG